MAGAAALAWPSAARAHVRPFAMVGVSWRSPRQARIELRVRLGDAAWSPWALASAGGHGGDGQAGLFGEPLWVGRADQVQLRGGQGVDGVRVHPVPAAVAAPAVVAAALPLAAPVLPAGPGQPPIIARSAWAHDHARPRAGPFYGSVQLAFVHHTDNPNGYARGEVPAILLAMFDYHRYVRGYFDIAYNFIIDAFGRIWEGRAGGVDAPVLGAHAGAFNGVSTGIAVLGTFMDSVPPAAGAGRVGAAAGVEALAARRAGARRGAGGGQPRRRLLHAVPARPASAAAAGGRPSRRRPHRLPGQRLSTTACRLCARAWRRSPVRCRG